jgi:hypothetical protein
VGFTPVEWESGHIFKVDPSLKSFFFTLKNPHNFPASKFSLTASMERMGLFCGSSYGPVFGHDIIVYGNCNANTGSQSSLGCSYENDTGLDGETVFAGSNHFTVKEIQVFEVRD